MVTENVSSSPTPLTTVTVTCKHTGCEHSTQRTTTEASTESELDDFVERWMSDTAENGGWSDGYCPHHSPDQGE